MRVVPPRRPRVPAPAWVLVCLVLASSAAFGQVPDSTVQGIGMYESGREAPSHVILGVIYEHRWDPDVSQLPDWDELYTSLAAKAETLGADLVVETVRGTQDPTVDGYARWVLGLAAVSSELAPDTLADCENCVVGWYPVDVDSAGASSPDSLLRFEHQAFLIARLKLAGKGFYLRDDRGTVVPAEVSGGTEDSARLAAQLAVVRGAAGEGAAAAEDVTLTARLIWTASGDDAWGSVDSMIVTRPGFDYVSGPDGVTVMNKTAGLFGRLEERGGVPDSDLDGVPDSRDRELHTRSGAEVDADGVARDDDGDGVPNGIDREPDTPPGVMVNEWGETLDTDHDGVPDGPDKCPGTPPEYAVDRNGCPCEILADSLVAVLLNRGVLTERFHFALDSAELGPEAKARLDTIGVSLSGLPELRFLVEGHCDDQGDAAYNDRLSEQRARASVRYLVEKYGGLDASQFEVVGYGKRRPLAEGTDEVSRASNRRVEFRVVNPEEAMMKVKVRRFRLRSEGSGACGEAP